MKKNPSKEEIEELYKTHSILEIIKMFSYHIPRLFVEYNIKKRSHSDNQKMIHNRKEVRLKKSIVQRGKLNSMYGTSRKGKLNPNYGKGDKLRGTKQSAEFIKKRTKNMKAYMNQPKIKEMVRLRAIKKLKYKQPGWKPFSSKVEILILDFIEKQLNINIERQHEVCGYFLDGYCKEHNLAFEVDEKYHYNKNGKLKIKDIERQIEIQNKLNCNFIRINEKYMRFIK